MTMFEEICGFESPKPVLQVKKAAELPWDADPLWSYSPPSASSLTACNKIQDEAFARELIGEIPSPLQSVPELESMFSVPRASADLGEFVKRVAKEAVLQKRLKKCACKLKITLHDGTVLEDPKRSADGSYYEKDGVKYLDKVGLPTSVATMSLCRC